MKKKNAAIGIIFVLCIVFIININSKSKSNKVELSGVKAIEDVKVELLDNNIVAINKLGDSIIGIGGNKETGKNKLFYLTEDDTWKELYEFEKRIKGTHVNNKNELFVSIANKRWEENNNCELYKSKDRGKTFNKVLDIESGVVLNWNMDSDDKGNMYVSEYGNKKLKDNPRRIYKSKDYGESWEIVYNPDRQEGYHNHVIKIDKTKGYIYQVVGDDDKHILKSEDEGKTWNKIAGGYHPTSAYQIDNKLIFGLDAYPISGFRTLDIDSDKLIHQYRIPLPNKGPIYDIEMIDGVLYAGALSYNYNDWPGSLLVSRDKGYSWDKILEWPEAGDIGLGMNYIIENGDYVYIGGSYPAQKNNEEPYWHEGTIKLKKVNRIKNRIENKMYSIDDKIQLNMVY